MNQVNERELDWNDQIEKESEFTLLPEGEYSFSITSFERQRHNGSEKLPPCNKAVLGILITAPNGDTITLSHNLFLHTKTEGMLSAFFIAIGQKQHGEKVTMNWNNVIGSTGKLKLGVRDWVDKNGETRQSNEIKKFLEPAEKPTFTAGSF